MKNIIVLSLLLFAAGCREKTPPAVLKDDIYYTCSMHPQISEPVPGKCPICGMELIAVKKDAGQGAGAVILSDQQVQLGNIQTDTVGSGSIGDKTILSATLTIDESKTVAVNTRIAGRIEKLYFKSSGEYIHKGDRLYDLYSEELNNAKQEYMLAVEKQKLLGNSIIDFKQVVESSRNKLLLWGMTESQVADLPKTKSNSGLTTFYSPSDGTIMMLESHEGDYVSEGTVVLRLSNLSGLWAEAQVFSSQLSAFDSKSTVMVQLPELSKEIPGRVDFASPEINPAARVDLIRVSIPNPDGLLKPGMPAYVVLKNRKTNSLTLPTDAIIRNEKGSLVWILTGHNTFKSIMIKTGLEDGERVEIISGLKTGDIVVTRGAYLLNSEYILKNGTEPMAGHEMF